MVCVQFETELGNSIAHLTVKSDQTAGNQVQKKGLLLKQAVQTQLGTVHMDLSARCE